MARLRAGLPSTVATGKFVLLSRTSEEVPLATLQELLLTPENAPHLIADTKALVDSELASKGITAVPLKGAYKAITAFAPGYYDEVISAILPGVVYQLEPYWVDFQTSGGADFGDYLAKRGGEASESLLAVTDDMAENCSEPRKPAPAVASAMTAPAGVVLLPGGVSRSRTRPPASPRRCGEPRPRRSWPGY
jgi:hypothetical protein